MTCSVKDTDLIEVAHFEIVMTTDLVLSQLTWRQSSVVMKLVQVLGLWICVFMLLTHRVASVCGGERGCNFAYAHCKIQQTGVLLRSEPQRRPSDTSNVESVMNFDLFYSFSVLDTLIWNRKLVLYCLFKEEK